MKLSDTFPSELDDRVRRLLLPVRITASGGGVRRADFLLEPHSGQTTIWSDDGAVLEPGAWLLVDFGNEIHGSVQLVSVRNPESRPTKLRIRFGESVSEAYHVPNNDHAMHDMVIEAANMGTAEAGMTAFRFVRIDNADTVSCSLREIRAVFLFHDFEYLGSFRCSEPLLNDIWTAAARTVQLCMQEYLWDAPKRDRLVWMGDMHPEVCAVADIFGKVGVVERSLDLVRDETPLPRFMNGILSYTVSWGLSHYSWFRAFGDLKYLGEQQDYLRHFVRVLEELALNDQEMFVRSGLIDWSRPHDESGVLAGAFQAQCVWALRCFAELFEALSDQEYAARARRLADSIAAFPGNPGNARTVLVHRVLAGMEDAETANRTGFSVSPFTDMTTFQGFYLLKARALAGDFAGALDVIRNYWGGMLRLGSTTFWEHFELAWMENASRIDEMPREGKRDVHRECGAGCFRGLRNSFCHGWGAGAASWIAENILGIRRTAPGGASVEIEPHLCGLSFVRGSIPTSSGILEAEHRAADGHVETKILKSPAGVRVKVLPGTL